MQYCRAGFCQALSVPRVCVGQTLSCLICTQGMCRPDLVLHCVYPRYVLAGPCQTLSVPRVCIGQTLSCLVCTQGMFWPDFVKPCLYPGCGDRPCSTVGPDLVKPQLSVPRVCGATLSIRVCTQDMRLDLVLSCMYPEHGDRPCSISTGEN